MASDPTTTMDTLTACVCEALDTIGRPACACGLTVGPPAPGPSGCACQVSAFLERIYPVTGTTFQQDTRLENCRKGPKAADISLVVLRCYPAMDEQGNMPTLDATTPFAHNLNTDMAAVWNALECCGEQLAIRESAVDADPEGGWSGFAIRVSVMVSLPQPEVVGS